MDIIAYMSQMLGVPSTLEPAIHTGIGVAGDIMKVNGMFQSFRLQKRLSANEKQLQIIKSKIETSENEVFYKQEVFPLIVKQLMNEDEDAKAKIIIDGFEYVIDNELKEIERIYNYYDVLSELRYSDIMMFVEDCAPYGNPGNNFNVDFYNRLRNKREEYLKKPKNYREEKEKTGIKEFQKTKLKRLGLIEERVIDKYFKNVTNENDELIKRTMHHSYFGEHFFNFFALED